MKKILHLLPLMLLMVACSDNQEKEAAALYNRAEQLYQAGEYIAATDMLDSLATTYPKATDIQRDAIKLQCQVNQKRYEKELAETDSLYTVALMHRDSLISNFVLTSEHQEQSLANYIYNKAPKNTAINKSQIRAHVNERGYFELTSIYCATGSINHTHIAYELPGGDVVTSAVIPNDQAINYRYKSGSRNIEIITYKIEQCEDVVKAIAENAGSTITIKLIGDKSAKVTLDAKSIETIIQSYNLAKAFEEVKNVESRLKFCTEQLNLANRQLNKQ